MSTYLYGAFDCMFLSCHDAFQSESTLYSCGYFCIEFINYMVKGKTLLDYTNLFSPNDFEKNNQVIKRIFKNE